MKQFEVTYENCKDCQYCNAENGQSDWFCDITNEQWETEDVPCKSKHDGAE